VAVPTAQARHPVKKSIVAVVAEVADIDFNFLLNQFF